MKVKHLVGVIVIVLVAIGIVTFFSSDNQTNIQYQGPEFLYSIIGDSSENRLKEPVFATSDSKGNIFVSDAGSRRISVFNSKGSFLYSFGGQDSQKPLQYPYGIGIIDNNRVVVADTGGGALYEYDVQGNYLKTLMEAKTGFQPGGVFVAADKTVYVTDLVGKQVLVFSKEGQLMNKIKPMAIGLGSPQGIAVNNDGTIWVADGGNYNVKLMKPNGEMITVFDGGPKWPLTMAKGLAVDKKGRVYISDTLSDIIRVFDKDGNDLFSFGPNGSRQSMFKMPLGLSIDSQDRIYIADQGNNMIQVWGWK